MAIAINFKTVTKIGKKKKLLPNQKHINVKKNQTSDV